MIFDLDVGFTLQLDCKTDVSAATTYDIAVKEQATSQERLLTAALNGTNNNIIERVVTATDFPNPGKYFIQAKVNFASGPLYGDIKEIQIREAINP